MTRTGPGQGRPDPELASAIEAAITRQRGIRRAAGMPEQIEAEQFLALLASAVGSTR